MRVWRLTRTEYLAEALSGAGAARVGNRWNSRGVPLAYTSSSRPLAVLEMLVHVSRRTVPENLWLLPIDVPDELAAVATGIPRDWDAVPHQNPARRFGDRWVAESRSLALLVPSVVLPKENNLLINPAHPDIQNITVRAPEPFRLDRRLFR